MKFYNDEIGHSFSFDAFDVCRFVDIKKINYLKVITYQLIMY